MLAKLSVSNLFDCIAVGAEHLKLLPAFFDDVFVKSGRMEFSPVFAPFTAVDMIELQRSDIRESTLDTDRSAEGVKRAEPPPP